MAGILGGVTGGPTDPLAPTAEPMGLTQSIADAQAAEEVAALRARHKAIYLQSKSEAWEGTGKWALGSIAGMTAGGIMIAVAVAAGPLSIGLLAAGAIVAGIGLIAGVYKASNVIGKISEASTARQTADERAKNRMPGRARQLAAEVGDQTQQAVLERHMRVDNLNLQRETQLVANAEARNALNARRAALGLPGAALAPGADVRLQVIENARLAQIAARKAENVASNPRSVDDFFRAAADYIDAHSVQNGNVARPDAQKIAIGNDLMQVNADLNAGTAGAGGIPAAGAPNSGVDIAAMSPDQRLDLLKRMNVRADEATAAAAAAGPAAVIDFKGVAAAAIAEHKAEEAAKAAAAALAAAPAAAAAAAAAARLDGMAIKTDVENYVKNNSRAGVASNFFGAAVEYINGEKKTAGQPEIPAVELRQIGAAMLAANTGAAGGALDFSLMLPEQRLNVLHKINGKVNAAEAAAVVAARGAGAAAPAPLTLNDYGTAVTDAIAAYRAEEAAKAAAKAAEQAALVAAIRAGMPAAAAAGGIDATALAAALAPLNAGIAAAAADAAAARAAAAAIPVGGAVPVAAGGIDAVALAAALGPVADGIADARREAAAAATALRGDVAGVQAGQAVLTAQVGALGDRLAAVENTPEAKRHAATTAFSASVEADLNSGETARIAAGIAGHLVLNRVDQLERFGGYGRGGVALLEEKPVATGVRPIDVPSAGFIEAIQDALVINGASAAAASSVALPSRPAPDAPRITDGMNRVQVDALLAKINAHLGPIEPAGGYIAARPVIGVHEVFRATEDATAEIVAERALAGRVAGGKIARGLQGVFRDKREAKSERALEGMIPDKLPVGEGAPNAVYDWMAAALLRPVVDPATSRAQALTFETGVTRVGLAAALQEGLAFGDRSDRSALEGMNRDQVKAFVVDLRGALAVRFGAAAAATDPSAPPAPVPASISLDAVQTTTEALSQPRKDGIIAAEAAEHAAVRAAQREVSANLKSKNTVGISNGIAQALLLAGMVNFADDVDKDALAIAIRGGMAFNTEAKDGKPSTAINIGQDMPREQAAALIEKIQDKLLNSGKPDGYKFTAEEVGKATKDVSEDMLKGAEAIKQGLAPAIQRLMLRKGFDNILGLRTAEADGTITVPSDAVRLAAIVNADADTKTALKGLFDGKASDTDAAKDARKAAAVDGRPPEAADIAAMRARPLGPVGLGGGGSGRV